jgi:hypothetical protein
MVYRGEDEAGIQERVEAHRSRVESLWRWLVEQAEPVGAASTDSTASAERLAVTITGDASQVQRAFAVAEEDLRWMEQSRKLHASRLLFQARVATTKGLRRRWWRFRHWAKVQEIALERKLHEERRREAAR